MNIPQHNIDTGENIDIPLKTKLEIVLIIISISLVIVSFVQKPNCEKKIYSINRISILIGIFTVVKVLIMFIIGKMYSSSYIYHKTYIIFYWIVNLIYYSCAFFLLAKSKQHCNWGDASHRISETIILICTVFLLAMDFFILFMSYVD